MKQCGICRGKSRQALSHTFFDSVAKRKIRFLRRYIFEESLTAKATQEVRQVPK